MEINKFKSTIDPLIQAFIQNKIKSLPLHDDKKADIALDYIKLFLNEGKRIRSYIAYLSYKANGGTDDKKATNLLVFLELFHAFALIHDDIMDQAETRHGIKTAHRYISDKLSKNDLHFGESQAILLGDNLLAWSFELLNGDKDFPQIIMEEVRKAFSLMIDEVMLGQMMDMDLTLENDSSINSINTKTLLKSAYYSFIRPLHIGALLSGKTPTMKFIIPFGENLGMAFQNQDDLLNLKYDEQETHKSSMNDIETKQQTIFTNYIFTRGRSEDQKILNEYFGKKLSSKDRQILKKMFEDSGALSYGERIIVDNLNTAKRLLEKEKIEDQYKKLFIDLIEKIEKRTS